MSDDAAQDPDIVVEESPPSSESEALAAFKAAARAFKAAEAAYHQARDAYAAAIKRLGEEAIK